jgi:endonuclease/exonuclease/phosphatase family metal-dependent hydrolase
MHLFNVHLGLALRERAHQVVRLVEEHVLGEWVSGPRVIIGDLNEWFPGAVGRTLRREFHGHRMRRTHPSPMPLFALDRIYWDRHLHAERFQVHRSRLARVASDHLPVVAHLRWSPAPPGENAGDGTLRPGRRMIPRRAPWARWHARENALARAASATG